MSFDINYEGFDSSENLEEDVKRKEMCFWNFRIIFFFCFEVGIEVWGIGDRKI